MGYNSQGDWGWIGISQFRPCGTSGRGGTDNNPNMERVAYKRKPLADAPVLVGAEDGRDPFSIAYGLEDEVYTNPILEPTFIEKYGFWIVVVGGGLVAYFMFKK